MVCDVCHEAEMAWLIGNGMTGEQTAVCAGCIIGWAGSVLISALDAEGLERASEGFGAAAQAARQTEEPPKRGGRRGRKQEPAATPPDPEPAPPVAPQAAADDG
jgi:hypothetical protein